MKKVTYIQIQKCCEQYNIELSFVQQLQEYEIVHIETADDEMVISEQELSKLEKMVRLHHELDINLAHTLVQSQYVDFLICQHFH